MFSFHRGVGFGSYPMYLFVLGKMNCFAPFNMGANNFFFLCRKLDETFL